MYNALRFMGKLVYGNNKNTPHVTILIPFESAVLWERVCLITREEITEAVKEFKHYPANNIPGLVIKPLYK